MSSTKYLQETHQLAGEMSTGDTTTNRTKDIAGFFKLPRELRDKIYDLLCVDNRTTCVTDLSYWGHPYPRATVTTRRPILNALLLNRRFKSEFEERPAAREHHTTVSSYSSLENFKTMVYPTFLEGSTYLVFNIEFHHTCKFCEGQWIISRSALQTIARLAVLMPNLRTIHVHYYFGGLTYSCDQKPCALFGQWNHGGFINLAGFMVGAVRCWSTRPSTIPSIEVSWYSSASHGNQQPLRFAKWTERQGLQFDGEVAKRCKDKTGHAHLRGKPLA